MRTRILVVAFALGIVGCEAQEGLPAVTTPGLPPTAVPDVVVVQTDSTNNPINALNNDIDLSGTGLTITTVTVDQTLPPMAGATATTNGTTVTFTPPAGFVGVVTLMYTIEDGTGATGANSSAAIAVSVLPIAPPPVAIPDVAVVTQDSGANDIDVLANDVDLSGGGLTVTAVSVATSLPPAAHTVAIAGNQVRFTPAAAFVGTVVVNYTATDGNGETADGVLTVVVSPLAVPSGPVPVPDAVTVAQDSGAANHDVLANDIDPAGGGLTVTAVSITSSLPNVAHTVAINSNQVRFTPAAGFAGVVLIGYTATDINGDSADGVLTVVVSPLALAVGPVTIPDVAVVAQDSGAANHDVLVNDIDPAGGGLTVTGVMVTSSLPNVAHTVTINGNQVRFTPAAGFSGVVVITYTATDINGADAPGVLTIVVQPAGLAVGPVPVPDAATVAQDSGATDIDVLANDIDPVGLGLTVTDVTVTSSLPNAVHTVAIVGNQVRFTPAASFAGAVVVTYEATDDDGNSANGVLSIVVTPLTPAVGPLAIPDVATVAQDSGATDIDVLANDIDFAGGGLTLTNAMVTNSQPAGLHTVAVVGNAVRFTPAAGFAGIVVITYEATDVNGDSANGVLTVVVSPLAPTVGPVPLPDAASVAQDSGATDIDVLANDVDPAGGGLTLTDAIVTASVPNVAHAVAVVGNQVRFTPAAGFAGAVVITYEATDVNGVSANGVLNIVVTPVVLALGPVPVPDAAAVAQDSAASDIDVLVNDVDPAAGGLTLTDVQVTSSLPNVAHTVAIVGNQVRFTPAAGFAGTVVITYEATDVNAISANGVLNIVVTPLNPPVGLLAIPDAAVVAQDSVANDIDVLANDVDPAGGGLTLTNVVVTSSLPTGTHTVTSVANQVRFTPEAGFAGIVVVTYTAEDVNGDTNNGLLSITVNPAPIVLGPLAVPDLDTASSLAGAQSFDVLANDIDPAAGGLTLTNVNFFSETPPGSGAVAIVGNQVQYTPTVAYAGVVVISYTAEDINGNTSDSQLSLTVTP